ncbi:hypothetical protein [Thermocrinis sp.]
MKILIMEKNLLLASRIKNSLMGLEVRVGEDFQDEQVVFINVEGFDPSLIKEIKKKGAKKVIAYCGHKRTDLIQKAKENGADLVVPNSKIVDARSLIEAPIQNA